MRITTDHARSSYGCPVILDDDGAPLDYADGVQAVRRKLGLSTAQLGEACGRSRRTVEDWEQGRYAVPTSALLAMAGLLGAAGKTRREPDP